MTKRILLKLEFCGTNFCGWQLQSESLESKAKHSIQFYVEHSIGTVLGRHGERHPVQGCGRTDSGVHALEYYCHFDIHSDLEPKVENLQKLAHALTGILPRGISVLMAVEVPLNFHALKSAMMKIYEYRLFLRNEAPAINYDFMYWLAAEIDAPPGRRDFDFQAFCHSAKNFLGTHDFAALASAGSNIKNTVRTISKIEIFREKFPHNDSKGDLLRIRFWGNGFLKQMVRNMVGTLIEVGIRKRDDSEVRFLLDQASGKVRKDAGKCAAASGLFLSRVVYDHPESPFSTTNLFSQSESLRAALSVEVPNL